MSRAQKLLAEARGLAADTEELIEQIAEQSGSGIAVAREKAREAVARARAEITEFTEAGAARVRAAGQAGQEYVRAHPVQTIAGVALAALIAAALIWRGSKK